MVKIGFYGVKSCDTIQYMASILAMAGKRVALLDKSEGQLLADSLNMPRWMDDMEAVDISGADFYRIEKDMEGASYEFCLIFYGMRPEQEEVGISILVVDYDRQHLRRSLDTHKKIKGMCSREYLLIRDMGSGIKMENYIMEIFQGYEKEQVYVSRESVDDIRAMLNCQYESVPMFSNISNGHHELVTSLCESLLCSEEEGYGTKEYQKLVRAVERGRTYHSGSQKRGRGGWGR